MSDFGSASGNGALNEGSFPTAVFVEVHSQNNVTSAASSGVPGGLGGESSALNNLGPGDSGGYSAPIAGGVSYTTAFAAIYNVGGSSAFGPNNPSGAGSLSNLFRVKNPA